MQPEGPFSVVSKKACVKGADKERSFEDVGTTCIKCLLRLALYKRGGAI